MAAITATTTTTTTTRTTTTTTTTMTTAAAVGSTSAPHARDIRLSSHSLSKDSLFAETYHVRLDAARHPGALPVDRRCLPAVFFDTLRRAEPHRVAKGCVLLVPGFASNRKVFDLRGDLGSSLLDFLAMRGYDAFATDLRGTQESLDLGCQPPMNIREFITVDLPTVIQFVKAIGGYKSIFLMGHSMGAALCCAYAGNNPEDVAGVIHLAGLYHFSVPIAGHLLQMIPVGVRHALRNLTDTVESILFKCLSLGRASDESARAVQRQPTPSASALAVDTSSRPRLTQTEKWLISWAKTPIPLIGALDVGLQFGRLLPKSYTDYVLHKLMFPSPWLPFACENPAPFLKLCTENPTLGLYLSLIKMALHDDYYNTWKKSPHDLGVVPHSWNALYGDLKAFESTSKVPILFAFANRDGILKVRDTLAGYDQSNSVWKTVVQYARTSPADPSSSSNISSSSANASASSSSASTAPNTPTLNGSSSTRTPLFQRVSSAPYEADKLPSVGRADSGVSDIDMAHRLSITSAAPSGAAAFSSATIPTSPSRSSATLSPRSASATSLHRAALKSSRESRRKRTSSAGSGTHTANVSPGSLSPSHLPTVTVSTPDLAVSQVAPLVHDHHDRKTAAHGLRKSRSSSFTDFPAMSAIISAKQAQQKASSSGHGHASSKHRSSSSSRRGSESGASKTDDHAAGSSRPRSRSSRASLGTHGSSSSSSAKSGGIPTKPHGPIPPTFEPSSAAASGASQECVTYDAQHQQGHGGKHRERTAMTDAHNVVYGRRDSRSFKPYGSYVLHDVDFGHVDVLNGRSAEVLWGVVGEWLDDTTRRERAWRLARRFSM
ncbi:Alpha/Beta hydrolase protein [Entophlyctis helioformis]|nr:Alpha/Beta hydrolase protein [Entophlyctis helioformis]